MSTSKSKSAAKSKGAAKTTKKSSMRELNKKIVKWVSYSFFVLLAFLLILTFGVPSITQNMNKPITHMAVVNGQALSYADFVHFLSTDYRFAGRENEIESNDMMRQYVISLFVQRVLTVQYAQSIGVTIPREKVIDYIRDIPFFLDDDKKFSSERMDMYLKHFNMSFDRFFNKTEESLITQEFNKIVSFGAANAPDEILMQKSVASSNLQIEYVFLSNDEIEKRYADDLTVSESEIDKGMKDMEEEEDIQKTRDSVKTRLQREKLDVVKQKIIGGITQGEPFETAAESLGGTVQMSKPFSIGNPVYEDKEQGAMLYELYSDQTFYEDCLKTPVGSLARPVAATNGVYGYTVREKRVSIPERESISKQDREMGFEETYTALQSMLLDSFYESAKIERNYQKTEQQ